MDATPSYCSKGEKKDRLERGRRIPGYLVWRYTRKIFNFHFEVITYCPTIARKLSTLDTYVLFHDRSVVYNTKGYKCLPAFGYFD